MRFIRTCWPNFTHHILEPLRLQDRMRECTNIYCAFPYDKQVQNRLEGLRQL